MTHPFISADAIILLPEICKFCYIKKYRYVSQSLKIFFEKAWLDHVKLCFHDYDIIVCVCDISNKILSRESNYIVDVVM